MAGADNKVPADLGLLLNLGISSVSEAFTDTLGAGLYDFSTEWSLFLSPGRGEVGRPGRKK